MLLCGLLTAGVMWVCKRRGWVVQPRTDRWHRKPAPQFGGAALVLAFVAAAGLIHVQGRLLGVAGLTLLIAALGSSDELRSWKPITRDRSFLRVPNATCSREGRGDEDR